MIKETDLKLADGRSLHCYDSGDAGGLTVFWHHGSPNTGAPPEPLFPAAAERGIRWVSYDRPGYMSSTARPGRDKASVAADAAAVADALGVGEFAVLGHSGGGSHALACGALLPGRVKAVARSARSIACCPATSTRSAGTGSGSTSSVSPCLRRNGPIPDPALTGSRSTSRADA